MKRWIYGILIVALVPIQSTWLHGFSLNAIRPDLGFLFAYFVGFYAGASEGLAMGMLAGALMDLASGGPIGLNFVTKGIVGATTGIMGRFFLSITGMMTMGIIFLVSIVSGILTYAYHQTVLGDIAFAEAFRWIILPEALYNAVLGGVLLWIARDRLAARKEAAA